MKTKLEQVVAMIRFYISALIALLTLGCSGSNRLSDKEIEELLEFDQAAVNFIEIVSDEYAFRSKLMLSSQEFQAIHEKATAAFEEVPKLENRKVHREAMTAILDMIAINGRSASRYEECIDYEAKAFVEMRERIPKEFETSQLNTAQLIADLTKDLFGNLDHEK